MASLILRSKCTYMTNAAVSQTTIALGATGYDLDILVLSLESFCERELSRKLV